MTPANPSPAPDHTAVRVALWRALHVEIDPPPHVFHDTLGAQIAGETNWRIRPDMDPTFSRSMRASIVGRARCIEDLLEAEVRKNALGQYVILGAGLDTFAQRGPDWGAALRVFELDLRLPQIWKKSRLKELGLPVPERLRFVPVDFSVGQSWWEQLVAAGFSARAPAFVASMGVSLYLSQETNLATMKQVATLPAGSTFAMTYLLRPELLGAEEKARMEFVMKKAEESRSPFLGLFSPEEILEMAKAAGFKKARLLSAKEIFRLYFSKRTDGLEAGSAEEILLAST
jgi:methyltransferase (TIGR00027 family)